MEFMLIIVFALGLAIGSFLNVLIDRLPLGQDVIRSRSHCDHCKHVLYWYELIPVFSWIFQEGKSRCCHKHISIQYPLIELVTGIGFILIFLFASTLLLFISSLILFCSFLVIFVVDLKTEHIPVEMLYIAGVGVLLRLCGAVSFGQLVLTHIFPALLGASFFYLLWFFSKGKAMGDGDIPLAFLIGLVTGYPGIIIAFYTAFLTGAVVGVILILRRVRTMKSHIPFGPFLILGMGIALVYSRPIIEWWSTLW
ncbi:MAG: prepilin peptidase [Candidatus Gottesmanbacteria bacterium]